MALARSIAVVIKCCLGTSDWREEADKAVDAGAPSRRDDYVMATTYKYVPVSSGPSRLDGRCPSRAAGKLTDRRRVG